MARCSEATKSSKASGLSTKLHAPSRKASSRQSAAHAVISSTIVSGDTALISFRFRCSHAGRLIVRQTKRTLGRRGYVNVQLIDSIPQAN
jgi:hypothetical protein